MKRPKLTTPKSELWHVCESLYFPLNLNIRAEATRYQYRIAIRHLTRFVGHEATIADLQDDVITAWMRSRMNEGAAPETVNEQAARIQAIWNWLAKRREVRAFPTFIKPKGPDTMPTALTLAQLQALFRSAGKERGSIGGIPAGLWWLSFLAFVFNTAERKGAALSLRVAWVDLDRALVTIPPEFRKGGRKWGNFRLWPETLPLIRAVIDVEPLRELVWPFPFCQNAYYTRLNRITGDAGIPVNRKHKTHCLRCTHATMRQALGGDATRALGHSDPATTMRHYIDVRQLPDDATTLCVPWANVVPAEAPPVRKQPAEAVADVAAIGWL